jgi:hypothetical protein
MVDPWSKFLESSQQLNNTIQQIPANNMRMALAGRQMQQFQDEDAQRDIYRNSDPNNPEATVAALQKGGYGKEAMTYSQAMQAALASKLRGKAEMYKLSQVAAEHVSAQPDDLILQTYVTVAKNIGEQTGQDPTPQIEWATRTAQQPGGLALIRQQAEKQAGLMKVALSNTGDGHQVVSYTPSGATPVGEKVPINEKPGDAGGSGYRVTKTGKDGKVHVYEGGKWITAKDETGNIIYEAAQTPETQGGIARAKKQGAADVERSEKSIDTDKKNTTILSQITQAENLLAKGPTGSGLGKAIDEGAAFFGGSTKGAEVNDELNVVSGWLTSNVPRMEGPQSNYDVENYKIMAGRVGDANLPVERRVASLKRLKEIVADFDRINEEFRKSKPQQDAESPPTGSAQTTGDKNGKGWILHVDAKGNKAYVGPNGEIEEVQ